MGYSELIKSFEKTRGYIREFYVYGFRHRMEIDEKSARSYDNERRRAESWLGEYMSFGQDTDGKRTYMSVDSRSIAQNPLYKAFKTKSFTDNDVMLHFYLMDILPAENGCSVREMIDEMEKNYLAYFDADILDESTIRKKLKEYEELGLIQKKKRGRESVYIKAVDDVNLGSWENAVLFYSEAAPLGVIGSFILDKYDHVTEYFRYKHHHIMKALDSEILYYLFNAISGHAEVRLTMGNTKESFTVIPYRVYVSTQYGRQYLFAWDVLTHRFGTYRLDHIRHASIGKKSEEWDDRYPLMEEMQKHIWGVSINSNDTLYHIEFDIHVEKQEAFVAERLKREKRCGTVEKRDDVTWHFSAELYDVREMLPWIRTFTGRIRNLKCDDTEIETIFWHDMEQLYQMYDVEEAETERKAEI